MGTKFLQQLAKKLSNLPKPDDGANREQSWMTAPQIASWWKQTGAAVPLNDTELGLALLDGWEHDPRFPELRIRPAKYPSFDMLRLWGHECVVGSRNRGEIAQRRCGPPSRFGEINVSPTAEVIFLSHSMLDLDFALRIRQALAERDLQPWLAEEKIEQGAPIFESVYDGIKSSIGAFVLIGRNALGSAWVHTEAVHEKVPVFVCDATDTELVRVLKSWKPPTKHDEINFDEALLDPLETAYRDAWNSMARDCDVLDRGAGGLWVRKERPEKFRQGAKNLLFELGKGQICFYPRRPDGWHFEDFDRTLQRFRVGD